MEESSKTELSSEFDDMLDLDFSTPLSKESKKKPKLSPRVSGMTTVFASMVETFETIEAKLDRLEAWQPPGGVFLVNESKIDRIDSRFDHKISKISKVNA